MEMTLLRNNLNEVCDNVKSVVPESRLNSMVISAEYDRSEMHTPVHMISDSNLILIEHCYARPRNWKPEQNFLRPTKTLFIPQRHNTKRKSTNPLAPLQECDDVIDVEVIPAGTPTIYDENKARHLMDECERHASCARIEEGSEDWEEGICKLLWTPAQSKLFNGIVSILNNDYLSRLAYSGSHNEPILRRTVVDKSVKRVRHLLATISWDPKLTQWLHHLLIDNLSTPYLSAYLDILQTLKTKLPTFVDKMMYGLNSSNRVGIMGNESLFSLLKRPWDPVASSLNLDKPKKLPGNPIIIIVPSAPYTTNSTQFRRLHKWTTLLSNLANLYTVHIGTCNLRMTMTNCIDQMLASTRAKIQEIKVQQPGRQIVLAGFNAGAALALQVAQVESVLCVLCLGFSLHTAEGKRGDLDDNLLELQCPVLFVIGQCSNTSLQEEMEDLRERMRVETGLIVVGAADDFLRVNKKKKRAEGITQSVVDRCIVDEIGEFISGILLSPYPPQIRQSPAHIPPDILKRNKPDRKRNNSNGSSLDSEPPSPTPRITRPVGRPPGSKSKTKLDAKWATHVAQGIPNSPSPNSSPTPTYTSPDHTNKPSKFPAILDFHKKNTNKLITSNDNVSKLPPTSRSASPAKMQALGLANRSPMPSGTALSSLLQGGIRTVQQKPNTGIKVLENITLNTNSTAKLVSSSGRTIDLSKITVLNSANTTKPGANYGNIMLMSDGKIKQGGATRYITSKKQLLGNKPPKPIQKIPYIPTSSVSSLLPPANLTSQDIMDLPIIFADDNQMLAPNVIQAPDVECQQMKGAPGKYVFLNKQMPLQGSSVNTQTLKRPSPLSSSMAAKQNKNVKYTKIILSKRVSNEDGKGGVSLPSEISVKKVDAFENIDLETELVATTVPKPNFGKDMKNITVIYKKPQDLCMKSGDNISKPLQTILNDQLAKRSAAFAELQSEEEGPSKLIKRENN